MNINIFKPLFDAVGLPYVGPYFTILVFCFILAFPLTALLAPRFSLRSSRLLILTAVAIAASLVGSKLFHLLFDEQWNRYAAILREHGFLVFLDAALNPVSAGHVFYGGLVVAYGASYLVVRHVWKEPTGRYADVAAFPIALGLALARIGCFLAGCCFGRPTPLLGVSFPPFSPAANELYLQGMMDSYLEATPPLVPTQLIESAVSFSIFAYLVANLRRISERVPGFFMTTLLFGYAIARFLLEFLRADLRGSLLGLSTSQWISLFILAALWVVRRQTHPADKTISTPLTCLIFIFLSAPLTALPPDKPLRHLVPQRWSTAEGLPSLSIAAIAQTPDHLVWLATPNGIVRFDGGTFFTVGETHIRGIADPRVIALTVDHKGGLWAGTEGGDILLYHPDSGLTLFNRFRYHDLPATPFTALVSVNNFLYAATIGGLIRLTADKREMIKTHDGVAPLLAAFPKKNIVIALSGPDLVVLDGSRTERITLSRLVGRTTTAAAFDDAGRLWIGTDQGEIIRLDHLADTAGRTVRSPDGATITAFAPDGETMWAGTRGKGVIRITATNKITAFGEKEGLAGSSVRALWCDGESLWVAAEAGLQRFSDGPAITLTTHDGLSSNLVYGLAQAPDGTLWIGTRGGGINRLRNGEITTYTVKNGLPSDFIGGLFLDEDNTLWVGTSGGLAALRPSGAITTYTDRNGLSHPVVGAIFRDRHRNLWIGTLDGTMHRFTPGAGNRPFRVFMLDRITTSRQIHQIFEDRSGRLWVAAQFGLALFNQGYVKIKGSDEGLPHPMVLTIAEDRDLNIWAGIYHSGIALIREDHVRFFSPRQGFPASDVFAILFDDERDRMWLATDNGILHLSRKTLLEHLEKDKPAPLVSFLGPADGAGATECSGGVHPTAIKGVDGKLYFSTLGGLVIVDPAAVGDRPRLPLAYIAHLDAGEGPRLPSREIRLPAERRSLAFEFGTIGFERRRKPFFRYRLDGRESAWRDTEEPRVRYDDLSPGVYHLIVQTSPDRRFYGAADEMTIIIGADRRPLYRAFIIAIAITLMILSLFVIRRVRRRTEPSVPPAPPPPASEPPMTPAPEPLSLPDTPPPVAPTSERPRYEKSRLDDDTANSLLTLLLDKMEREKLYKDPDITLPGLAEKVELSHHLLSQLINDRLGKNFNTFINEYRVAEVCRMLENPANRDKLLAIAYDAGFRSKSTFNAFFKKCTGKTPSEYRKSLDGGEVVDSGEMQD